MQPQPAKKLRQTPNFDFLFGKYGHSEITIPYLQVNMSFSDAAAYLSLVSDMPGSSSMEWGIHELFQREIDWKRVEQRIVPYLKGEKNPQFFNALTIALLPFKDAALHDFTEPHWEPPPLQGQQGFGKIASFGPITCGFWQEWDTIDEEGAGLGQLAWNLNQVTGVAIDGQHRLAAIKSAVQGRTASYMESAIPVIFVVLDPELGYTGPTGKDGVISTLRQLFIDLNKHAKVPSRGRQILLDDRDPASICVRSCVGGKLRHGREELLEDPPRLPLSLVDWHSEQAKFSESPYVTTVLGLDWIVGQILNISPLQDMMAYDDLGNKITTLQRYLEIDLQRASDRIKEDERYERPFEFEIDELEQIGQGFGAVWSKPLVHLLTGLAPYCELVEMREKTRSLSPEFANWYALRERAEEVKHNKEAEKLLDQFEKEIANREQQPIAPADFRAAVEEIGDLKQRRGLAFTVVFQRALILAYRTFVRVPSSMIADGTAQELSLSDLEDESNDSGGLEDSDRREQRAKELVRALNTVINREPGFLFKDCEFEVEDGSVVDRLWVGSFAQMEGAIDFSQAASKRGADWLLMVCFIWLFVEKEKVASFDRLVERMDDDSGGLARKMRECFNRMSHTDANSVAKRVLAGREQDINDENARRLVIERMKWFWNVLSR